MNHIIPARPSNRNAFTLIELLVTMAISSALLIVIATLITQTSDGYAMSQRSVTHLSQSRAFIQLFESELSLRLPETPLIHLSSADSEPERIAFVRTLPNDEQNPEFPGDFATSCYYVALVENSDRQPIPKLFRKILNPVETQSLIEAGDDAKFPAVDPARDEPVIDAVISFQATPMYRNPASGNDEPWDISIEHRPLYIELIIRTIDESFSRRINNPSEWKRISAFPKESELQMIHTVSRNISIGK